VIAAAVVMPAPCATAAEPTSYPTVGHITVYDPAFNDVVDAEAPIEKIADGISWAEGPAWMKEGAYLLFDDPKLNRMYRWSEQDGLSVFLEPSGYAGADDGTLREPGANGLFVEPGGTILLADSGSRSIERLDPATKRKTVLAERFEGKRFNSPNDVVRRSDGTIYFTDPPYGLKGIDGSPARELTISGVYRLDTDGSVHLLDGHLKYPNGIALSPDGNRLYVSNSDPANPIWKVYQLDARGDVSTQSLFSAMIVTSPATVPGNPDGMCMAADGTLFTAAPGGLLAINADGRILGRIETGTTVSNCTFGDDGRTLYMTSSSFIARVRIKIQGAP
jgi:gluconolactonase